MRNIFASMKNLSHQDFLIGYNNIDFDELFAIYSLSLRKFADFPTPVKIVLAERESIKFLAGFLAAITTPNCLVFLCNPDWRKQEWEQVFDLVVPDLIWGVENVELKESSTYSLNVNQQINQHPLIMIPTGGSSGKVKFAIHTWETLTASVKGFIEFFNLKQVNSFCTLPLYHVSGLMQFIRSYSTGGKIFFSSFKDLTSANTYNLDLKDFFISLVPTQLQYLLQNPESIELLAQFKTVLLGGAPAWDELLEKAKFYNIKLAPTYGMTETASQIATLKPDDFLNGKINSGKILPHARVTIRNQQGEALQYNQVGNITISASSLTLGYYPQLWENQNHFQVDDIGFIDTDGYLSIIGRNSEKIITGGENVYPKEVEFAIRATQLVVDVCVIGTADDYWGEAITAIYIPNDDRINNSELQTQIKEILLAKISKFKIPKYWIPVKYLPRNTQGKINRQELQKILRETAQRQLGHSSMLFP